MSERVKEDPHEPETIIENVEMIVVEPERQRSRSQRDAGDMDGLEDEFDVDRLSAEQRRVAAGLLRLYQSLCGSVPGQYWPQALLDSAGHFNRPPFPSRHSTRGFPQ